MQTISRPSLIVPYAAVLLLIMANQGLCLASGAHQAAPPARTEPLQQSQPSAPLSRTFPDILPDVHVETDPTFSWSLYYEDNISGSGNSDIDDFSNRYKPAMDVNLRGRRLLLDAHTEAEIVEYFSEKEWDTVDQKHRLNATYDVDPRTSLSLACSYSVQTDPDRFLIQEEGVPTPQGDYSVRRNKNKTLTYTLLFTHSPSPRDLLSFTMFRSKFKTAVTDGSPYYSASLLFTHAVSRRLSFNLNVTGSYFDFQLDQNAAGNTDFLENIVAGDTFDLLFDSDYTLRDYAVLGGFEYRFKNRLTLDASVGWRYTRSHQRSSTTDPVTGQLVKTTDTGSGDNITFNVSLTKQWSSVQLSLETEQDVGVNPDTGATYERRRYRADFRYALTPRLSAMLNLQFREQKADKNKKEFVTEVDRDTYFLSSGLGYEFNDSVAASLMYRGTTSKNHLIRSDSDRNTVMLTLNFSFPKPLVVR